MNITSSPVSQVDIEARKKQALAKVYKLILSFYQEAVCSTISLDVSGTDVEDIAEIPSEKEASTS